ncbi:hypothetical protein B0H16DRAFT_1480034 [Mycena metata]|uniref:Uncharacterized protein n=1 Tax=Mycena metata TaxID=1033252 RepID=A0AAD7H3Y5_9AGAR|nr:hypothetical protein B0H16DRAFT_1480034 [Mycena metata]
MLNTPVFVPKALGGGLKKSKALAKGKALTQGHRQGLDPRAPARPWINFPRTFPRISQCVYQLLPSISVQFLLANYYGANVNLDNISGLPHVRSTRWLASFSEGLHLFAAQRPTVAANLLAQYSSELTHLWAEFDQAAIIGNVPMLNKARVAIQTCIQTLINNIEQDNGAEPATQQGTIGTEEEGDDEIPELVWDDGAVVGR